MLRHADIYARIPVKFDHSLNSRQTRNLKEAILFSSKGRFPFLKNISSTMAHLKKKKNYNITPFTSNKLFSVWGNQLSVTSSFYMQTL